ncbi:hypothetical protein [Micromonospora sp. NPDC004551]|uniref:hypothetical protein n=1 Tax=Micromonospora sp. NPDC004551 TaxID=3154284 RepID=UPI0033ACF671
MASDERIRGALLAGLTVAALAAGAGWWRAAAPALGRTGPEPAPSTGAFLEPGIRLVDPRTGQVLPGPEADPDESVVIHEEPGGVARRRAVSHTVWEDQSLLAPAGPPVTRRANASDGAEFLFTVACSGAGALVVRFTGSSMDDTEQVLSCNGPPHVTVVNSRGGPLLVRFVALRDQIELDARLEALG